MKINYFNKAGTSLRLKRADFAKLARRAGRLCAPAARGRELSLIFIRQSESRRLNAVYRGASRPANVLSFFTGPKKDLGDIFICLATARRQAKVELVSEQDKLKHLFVHGLLHLLGYDHQTEREEKAMTKLEKKILN